MSRAHRFVWALVALVAMTATAIVARSARRAWTLVHPGRTRVSAAARRQAFADIPTLEDITLHTADGLSLRAVSYTHLSPPQRDESSDTVVGQSTEFTPEVDVPVTTPAHPVWFGPCLLYTSAWPTKRAC